MSEPALQSGLTRRHLVQAGGAATAVLYLGGLTGTASAAGVPSFLTRAAYTSLTDPQFGVVTGSGLTTTLRLTEVADLARARKEPSFAGRDDAFALLFSGPAGDVVASGIHELRHASLGAFSVFISPVGQHGGEQRYEVVVDRSVRLAVAQQDAPEPMQQTNHAAAQAPAVAAAAPAAAAGATAPAPASAQSAKRKKPVKLVQSAHLARRGGILTVDVRVAPGRGLVSVRATLLREGVEHARAARRLGGRAGVRLNLRQVQRTPPGGYSLRITVTDRNGKRTSSLRRVTVS